MKSTSAFLKSLLLPNRILYTNVFIVSIFSYVGLYFVLPHEIYVTIKNAIAKFIIPFNGGAFTYESLVCANLVYGLKPALKDLWCFTISLLAVRSPFIKSTTNYMQLPDIDLKRTKIISKHRDAAAVDFWRGRHLQDGALVPLPVVTSSAIYKSMLFDVSFNESTKHTGIKIHTTLSPSTPNLSDPDSTLFSISSSLFSVSAPSFLLFHHMNLINNALATSRRMRHQNKHTLEQVPVCFFCGDGQDSLIHIYTECFVISRARSLFFRSLSFSPSLLSTLSLSVASVPPSFPCSLTSPSFSSSPASSFSPLSVLDSSAVPSVSRSDSLSLFSFPSSPLVPALSSSPLLSPLSFPSSASVPVSSLLSVSVSSFPPSPLSPATLVPSTAGALGAQFPLACTFLCGVDVKLVLPILAFNFAVWKYRIPARAARSQQTLDWLCNRIIDIARHVNKPVQTSSKKQSHFLGLCPSVARHDALLTSATSDTAICYTDGSALGNPGPCGAGVSIFLREPDVVIDAGASLGMNTNNYGELIALSICLKELASAYTRRPFSRAIIFSDSAYAIRQITSNKAPKTHIECSVDAHKLYLKLGKLFPIVIYWVRAHVNVGGNHRVDFIAKRFAQASVASLAPVTTIPHASSTSVWGPGHPLLGLPLSCFAQNIGLCF